MDTVPRQTIGFRRRHLPHWSVAERPYFVTFRLKGSLSAQVERSLRAELAVFQTKSPSASERDTFRRERYARIEAILDRASSGPTHLQNESIARLVLDALGWLETQRGWLVYAATVMPNHIHVVTRNAAGHNDRLGVDLGVVKGYTGRQANRLLGATGSAFWLDENFDHWCRDAESTDRAVRYTVMNPVRAGLARSWDEWPWTRVHADYQHLFAPTGVTQTRRPTSARND